MNYYIKLHITFKPLHKTIYDKLTVEPSLQAVLHRCSYKNVFWTNAADLQEVTVPKCDFS